MRILLSTSKTLFSKALPLFAPEWMPICEVLFVLSYLNLSGHNQDARTFGFCHLFLEFSFSVPKQVPKFLQKRLFAAGQTIDTNLREFPYLYYFLFAWLFMGVSIALNSLLYWGMVLLELLPNLMDDVFRFLGGLALIKCLTILRLIPHQFVVQDPSKLILENVVFYGLEVILILNIHGKDQQLLGSVVLVLFGVKAVWLAYKVYSFYGAFKTQFIFTRALPDLIFRLKQDSFALVEYYMDKSVAVLNANYTVLFLLYHDYTHQVIGLTLMILFYELCEAFGRAVANLFKFKFKSLVSMGHLEGVFKRANLQLRIILFLCTILAILSLLTSWSVAYLFETERERQSEIRWLTCLLGFTAYSFVCNPVLFMLLKINGTDSLGYSVMWFLENKFRLLVSVPAFWFGSKWGLFGVFVVDVVIDAFMTMLLFRSFTLYFLMKTIVTKQAKGDLGEELMDLSV